MLLLITSVENDIFLYKTVEQLHKLYKVQNLDLIIQTDFNKTFH